MLSLVTSSRINSFSTRKQLFFGKISEMSNVEKFHSASESQHEPANFNLNCFAARTSEFQTYLICSTNQRIAILFAVQTSTFQTYLQYKPANFKLTCRTNQRISILFAVHCTSAFTADRQACFKFYIACFLACQVSG